MEPKRNSTDPPTLLCASWSPGKDNCKKKGTQACGNCRLVMYCGRECQKDHWEIHKGECKSDLSKPTWRPLWESRFKSTGQEPAFVAKGSVGAANVTPFGAKKKHLWGNMPAINVLKLAENEVLHHKSSIDLLFAASGDLRNVIKTLTAIPVSAEVPAVTVMLNDKDFDIVARNIIFLLLFLTSDTAEQAAETVLHLWYSALITKECLAELQAKPLALINDVCEKIAAKASKGQDFFLDPFQGKTFVFGGRSLRVVLKVSEWFALRDYFRPLKKFTAEAALTVRQATMMAPSRVDYLHRHLFALKPFTRVGVYRFRNEGLLLPFGQPRQDFTIPNPTFFFHRNTWPMLDNSDPFNSYSRKDVLATSSGAALNDEYGKLYFYLRKQFTGFYEQIRRLPTAFTCLCVNASELPNHANGALFDRIETSNVADMAWMGTSAVLETFRGLLKSKSDNPHATLLTLYMNAVPQSIAIPERMAANSEAGKRFMPFIQARFEDLRNPMGMMRLTPSGPANAETLFMANLGDYACEKERIFARYQEGVMFEQVAAYHGLVMKKPHTIIEQWPEALKLKPGQPGALEEFDTLIASGQRGWERYVEWKRAG